MTQQKVTANRQSRQKMLISRVGNLTESEYGEGQVVRKTIDLGGVFHPFGGLMGALGVTAGGLLGLLGCG